MIRFEVENYVYCGIEQGVYLVRCGSIVTETLEGREKTQNLYRS